MKNKIKLFPPRICSKCGKEVPQVFVNLLEKDKKMICGKCLFSKK